MDSDLMLQLAVKAFSYAAAPSGIVLTLLVFDFLLRIPVFPQKLPDKAANMKALDDAEKEMTRALHERRINSASRYNIPAAADILYDIGDEVPICRRKPVSS